MWFRIRSCIGYLHLPGPTSAPVALRACLAEAASTLAAAAPLVSTDLVPICVPEDTSPRLRARLAATLAEAWRRVHRVRRLAPEPTRCRRELREEDHERPVLVVAVVVPHLDAIDPGFVQIVPATEHAGHEVVLVASRGLREGERRGVAD